MDAAPREQQLFTPVLVVRGEDGDVRQYLVIAQNQGEAGGVPRGYPRGRHGAGQDASDHRAHMLQRTGRDAAGARGGAQGRRLGRRPAPRQETEREGERTREERSKGSGQQAGRRRVHVVAPIRRRAEDHTHRVPGLRPFQLGAADRGAHRRKPQRVPLPRRRQDQETERADQTRRRHHHLRHPNRRQGRRPRQGELAEGRAGRGAQHQEPQRRPVRRHQEAHGGETVGYHRHAHPEPPTRPLLPPRVPQGTAAGRQILLDPSSGQTGSRR